MSEMTVEQLRAAQEAEYGTYVATEPIMLGGARAFNIDDPVPKSHVERGVVAESQVRLVGADESAAPAPPSGDGPPAGNASLDAWRAFALTHEGVNEASINDLSRDELRERFGPKPGSDEGNV